MYNFIDLMDKLKEYLSISSDTELAQKLGFTRGNYYERKQRNSIPYENLVNLCKKENISIDELLNIEKIDKKTKSNNNFKDNLRNSIEKLNDKESKYFYYLIESELAKKEL